MAWIVSSDTVVRPDVMIVCGEQPPRHLERPPVLVVEVLSQSTASKDRLQKRELYQYHGVEHYLIADPDKESLLVMKLAEGGYEELSNSEKYVFKFKEGFEIELPTQAVFR